MRGSVDIQQLWMITKILRDYRLVFFKDKRDGFLNGEIGRQCNNKSYIFICVNYEFYEVACHQQ
jgi:hypothetical protein